MANLMLSVMGAFAEFERALLKERQREGITKAKQRGAYHGRQRILSDIFVSLGYIGKGYLCCCGRLSDPLLRRCFGFQVAKGYTGLQITAPCWPTMCFDRPCDVISSLDLLSVKSSCAQRCLWYFSDFYLRGSAGLNGQVQSNSLWYWDCRDVMEFGDKNKPSFNLAIVARTKSHCKVTTHRHRI